MQQVNVYASARIGDVSYQWLVFQEGDIARVDMHQKTRNGTWLRYAGLLEPLHGGSAQGLLEETVSRWLSTSADAGYDVERTS